MFCFYDLFESFCENENRKSFILFLFFYSSTMCYLVQLQLQKPYSSLQFR
jgi:hypothetical protein